MLPSGFEVPSKMAILAAYETHITSMGVANLHEQIDYLIIAFNNQTSFDGEFIPLLLVFDRCFYLI